MIFQQIASGSKANLYTVTANNGERLMIECGLTWAKLQKALNYDLNFTACLLTHEHKDHSKSVKQVMDAGIDVFSSKGTFTSLRLGKERRAWIVKHKTMYKFGEFAVIPFNSVHDAKEPLIYIVQCDGECLLFATDTSHIQQIFKFSFPLAIIALEVSYDKAILFEKVKAKTINEQLAKRLLNSHQEKSVAMKYIDESCDLSKCRQLHLLHTSDANLDKEKTRQEFEDKFFIETVVI